MDKDEPLDIQAETNEPNCLEDEGLDLKTKPVSWMLPRGFTTN